ncbi:MAG: transcriptional activator NhaR [Planctomycetota bacterium]
MGLADTLNFHHLQLFWLVAREGGVVRAAERLRLSPPTVSAQVRQLERALGEKLFVQRGRGLVLTEIGRVAFEQAEEIFTLGQELVDSVKGRPGVGPLRLLVGVGQALPKLIARRLMAPALELAKSLGKIRLVCVEDRPERLLAELGAHQLDLVLSDAPVPPGSAVRAYNHLLGECGGRVFATRALAQRYRRGFPGSLEGAPLLLPTENSSLRRSLEAWFESQGVRPLIAGEFEDGALLKAFGADGLGLFPAPSAVEDDVRRQYDVELVGRIEDVRERFYALSVERRIKNPAVLAICEVARRRTFREG